MENETRWDEQVSKVIEMENRRGLLLKDHYKKIGDKDDEVIAVLLINTNTEANRR